jgi:hypothetical protein
MGPSSVEWSWPCSSHTNTLTGFIEGYRGKSRATTTQSLTPIYFNNNNNNITLSTLILKSNDL